MSCSPKHAGPPKLSREEMHEKREAARELGGHRGMLERFKTLEAKANIAELKSARLEAENEELRLRLEAVERERGRPDELEEGEQEAPAEGELPVGP